MLSRYMSLVVTVVRFDETPSERAHDWIILYEYIKSEHLFCCGCVWVYARVCPCGDEFKRVKYICVFVGMYLYILICLSASMRLCISVFEFVRFAFVCLRACVRACVRSSVRSCVRACVVRVSD